MEGDELEMTRDELQKWIREKVDECEPIRPDLIEKCNVLQLLLERRETHAAKLLKLWESVGGCEASLKKQYSLLGWEYRDTDSEEDDVGTACEHIPHLSNNPVRSETRGCFSPAPRGHTVNGHDDKKLLPCIRNPVVSLTRLPEWKTTTLLPSTSQEDDREREVLSNSSDSGDQWEPETNSSDSDCSGFNSSSNKRRKKDQTSNGKLCKSHETQPVASKAEEGSVAETKAPQASDQTIAKDATKESPPAKTEEVSSVCTVPASSCQSTDKATDEATKNIPSVPENKLSVGMTVVARRKQLKWQQGKIKEILTKDGRLKYKVVFKDMGKMLVSGYHIAMKRIPVAEQLFVGARVVVKRDHPSFCPGLVAEVPCRRNFMRFLVFLDDHTAIYVGLSFLHKVYKPLTEPLDDIVDEVHRAFVRDYLETWPHPPQAQYRRGQVIKAEFNGVQQECEVCTIDCSLIEVVFKGDQHKEWIYRGSRRLEQVICMRAQMRFDKDKKEKLKESIRS